ncbi:hypothetical protein [Pseudogracilibacillus sp. ICA-222130]|uniref:hypothetical protein n=1 Tax=Pseudogracilibacillus sp. ICA-222130 TaxID=3134655 RepID=UPI0030BCCB26
MKQPMRFFAIGLFTAAILMFGYYSLFDQSTAVENAPVEDLIAQVEDEGYRVITEEEFITFSLLDLDEADVKDKQVEKEDKKKDSKKESDSSKEEKKDSKDSSSDKKKDEKEEKKSSDDKKEKSKKKKSKTITITTNEGVVTEDIADMLYNEKVIDDKQKFQDYMEDNDYSPYIQIGTFKVKKDMSFKELAEIFTTYPGSN